MSHDGAKLKLIRTATGASKPSYATRLGVTVRTLARWEQGRIPVPEDVMGHAYEHLDLILDVIDRQKAETEIEVTTHLHQLPEDLAARGADVQLWNWCAAYNLVDADINTVNGADVRWTGDR